LGLVDEGVFCLGWKGDVDDLDFIGHQQLVGAPLRVAGGATAVVEAVVLREAAPVARRGRRFAVAAAAEKAAIARGLRHAPLAPLRVADGAAAVGEAFILGLGAPVARRGRRDAVTAAAEKAAEAITINIITIINRRGGVAGPHAVEAVKALLLGFAAVHVELGVLATGAVLLSVEATRGVPG